MDSIQQLDKIRERFGDLQIESPWRDEMVFFLCENVSPQHACSSRKVEKPVLKLTNIPWEVSILDVKEFFHEYDIDVNGIHIPIDRATGKTRNEIFVEFGEFRELLDALARSHRKLLKSREMFLSRSSWGELIKAHFSRASSQTLLSADEEKSLIRICRFYKIHFSRKCAERPFEHICSLLRLAPWDMLGECARSQLHSILLAAVESILTHYSKQKKKCPCMLAEKKIDPFPLDLTLANRLIETALQWGIWDSLQLAEIEQARCVVKREEEHSDICCRQVVLLRERISELEDVLGKSL